MERFSITPDLRRYMRKNQSRSLYVTRVETVLTEETVTAPSGLSYLRYPIEVMADTPDVYLRLGETGALTTAEDATGNAHHGTYNGTVTNAAGSLFLDNDTAKNFDGSTGYVTIPDVILTTNASIEGIFVWTSGSASLLRDSSSGAAGWILAFDNGGNLAYRVGGTTFTTSTTTASLQGTAWHHYLLKKTGGSVSFQLDGTVIHTSTGAPDTASTPPWNVMKNGTASTFVPGRADEVAIYSSGLSDARGLTHFHAMTGVQE